MLLVLVPSETAQAELIMCMTGYKRLQKMLKAQVRTTTPYDKKTIRRYSWRKYF